MYGAVHRPDRALAGQLCERGGPLEAIKNALTLAAARRRLACRGDAPPLTTIRSLAYFLLVVEEVLRLQAGPEYFHHLRSRIARLTPAQ